jgi:hypothetical protein
MGTSLNPFGGSSITEEVTNNITNVTNYYNEVNQSTGFVDPAASSLAFNDTTREFTITPVSESFVFYAFGVRYEKEEAESVIIDDVVGQWYISYNASGVLVASQTIWDLSTQVPVGSVYWSGSEGTIDEEEPQVTPSKFSNLYVIGVSVPGTLTDEQLLLFHVVVGGENIELPKRLPYSYIKCGTAPALEAVFNILVNGSSVGSATIASGQTTGSFTFNTKTTLSGGDIVKLTGPSSADVSLADVGITIKGTRK